MIVNVELCECRGWLGADLHPVLKCRTMKSDETRVYLWVTNFGEDASVVTQLIGLEPTFIKRAGQPNQQFPKTLNRIHCWELGSPLPPTAHINAHIDALLELLEPHAAGVKAIAELFEAGINAVVYYYEDFTPGIHLSAHAINRMAAMNLSVDFDLYFLGAEE